MADDLNPEDVTPVADDIAKAFAAELLSLQNLGKMEQVGVNALAEFFKLITVMFMRLVGPLAAGVAGGMIEGENAAGESIAQVSSLAVKDLLGVDIPPSRLRRGSGGGLANGDRAIGDAILRAMTPASGPLEPSDEPAKKYLGAVTNFAVEGWMSGWSTELLSSMLPFDIGHIESFGELDDILAKVMGFERISRSVLRPLVDATIVTPMKWQTNKTYRPELMAASMLAREIARNRKTRAQAFEELARQGYRDDHIEALLNDARKTISVSDVLYMVREGGADENWAKSELRNAGYDDDAIRLLFEVENVKRYRALQERIAALAAAAYVDSHMSQQEMLSVLSSVYQDEHERDLFLQATELQKASRLRRPSDGEMQNAVKRRIISRVDYRRYLRDEGYDEDAIAVKELLLFDEINGDEQAKAERERIAREKAAAEEAKRVADALRRADLEAKQLAIGPGLGEIKRAVIHGLIGMTRYEVALRATGVADSDIGFLVEQLQADRDEYIADLKRAADAEAAAKAKGLSTADLDRAFFAGIIGQADYAARLRAAGFADDAVGILVTLAVKRRDDARAAQELRDRIAAEQANKDISLQQAERAVERGIWTMIQYADYIRAAGYNDGAAATLTALLRDRLAELAEAAKRRAELLDQAKDKGASIASLESAVLRGLRTIDVYESALRDRGYTSDDVALLMDLLSDKLDEAAEARRLHDEAAEASKARALTLGQVERGVINGVISQDAYAQYLAGLGYSDADAAVLLGNLAVELQAHRDAERVTEGAQATTAANGLDLGELTAKVRAGELQPAQAAARLTAAGLSTSDVAALVSVIDALRLGDADATQRETTIDGELAARSLSLSQFQDAVTNELRTLDDYGAFLLDQGYDLVDAQLLVTLLAMRIDAKAAKAAPKG